MVTTLFLTHWHWWGLAGLFILAEILAPCVYFMAWALAAAIVGLVVRVLPGMPGLWQLGLFFILATIFLAFAYFKRRKLANRTNTANTGR